MFSIPYHYHYHIINKKIIWFFILFSSLLICFIDCQIDPDIGLVNGGFETGPPMAYSNVIPGWSTSGLNVFASNTAGGAHSGNQFCLFASNIYVSLQQTVTVITQNGGLNYELIFWLRSIQPAFPFLAFAQFTGYDEQQLFSISAS